MVKAIRMHEQGGPEVMKLEDVDLGKPDAGQVQIKHSVIGLNYIDTYHRSGLYPLPLPSGIGMEASGTVEALGDGVTDFAVGDRVQTFINGVPMVDAELTEFDRGQIAFQTHHPGNRVEFRDVRWRVPSADELAD